MKEKMLYIVTTVVFVVGLCILYYYYPRKVSFELAKEIEPFTGLSSPMNGFNYVKDENELFFWLIYCYDKPICKERGLMGYSLPFVKRLASELDFETYDYLITYKQKLQSLFYSSYLTRTKDGLYFDKLTPLIPEFYPEITDKVYIYRIKKNNKFRAPGP